MDQLLDAVERRLPPLRIEQRGLLLDQPFDVGIAPVRERAARRDERVQARRGVATGAARGLDDVPELLVPVLREERRPFQRPRCEMSPAVVVDSSWKLKAVISPTAFPVVS